MAFELGNKVAVGNKGGGISTRQRLVTQQMISELNEMTYDINDKGKPVNGKKTVTKIRRLVKKLIHAAMEGDTHAMTMIFDRVEGKPVQAVITAEAGTEAAQQLMQMPENFRDLPQSELIRLYRESVAAGAVKAAEQTANTNTTPEPTTRAA